MRLIMGMLMELAAPTATKGTKRPTSGGSVLTAAFSPSAVASAPPVAARYEETSVLCGICESPALSKKHQYWLELLPNQESGLVGFESIGQFSLTPRVFQNFFLFLVY